MQLPILNIIVDKSKKCIDESVSECLSECIDENMLQVSYMF